MKKKYVGIALLVTIIFMFPETGYMWKEQTHQMHLTLKALELLSRWLENENKIECFKEIFNFKNEIMQGAHDEDFPFKIRLGVLLRANNHYRHALTGKGLSGSATGRGDPDADALNWAWRNPKLNEAEEFGNEQWKAIKDWGWTANDLDRGNMSWINAINRYGYTSSSKKLAYYTLGFILHLLQDMGCPEHVHDDPHGGSGYTGFEKWVYDHWNYMDRIKDSIDISVLKPKRFRDNQTLDDFFKNLSWISYGACRFKGGELSQLTGLVDQNSDLAKMFFIKYRQTYSTKREWLLENKNGRITKESRIIDGREALISSGMKYNPLIMRQSPFWLKGLNYGEWWETSLGLGNSPGQYRTLEQGYYYIELSGESPTSGERHLYPTAYLPSPLPQVEAQCRNQNWEIDHIPDNEWADQVHLYTLIARAVFPHIVEHTAGFIQHYFDIVNHPPYVESVFVYQNNKIMYWRSWDPRKEEINHPAINIMKLPGRTLKRYHRAENDTGEPLNPGEIAIKILFSEPVKDVKVEIGGLPVRNGELVSDDVIWRGNFVIPENASGEYQISIWADDQNSHYHNKGGNLDYDPETPARRIYLNGYVWNGYEGLGGWDRNHKIKIKKKKERQDISRELFIAGTWDWFIGPNLMGYVEVIGSGSSGTLKGYDRMSNLANTGKWHKVVEDNEIKYKFKWDKGDFTDTLTLTENGMILRGGNNVGTSIRGERRIKR
jgi:hypothetical protein